MSLTPDGYVAETGEEVEADETMIATSEHKGRPSSLKLRRAGKFEAEFHFLCSLRSFVTIPSWSA